MFSHAEAEAETSAEDKAPRMVVDDPSLNLDSFTIMKVLGKGAFGKVMLVYKKEDVRTLYALKTLQKKKMLQTSQIAHVHTERMVLEKVRSPFMVHLAFAFQTDEKLYMVLEYCNGGDLFHWITVTAQKEKRYGFGEERSRLYAAELISAIHAMHQKDIIHRDLKPENLLLDCEGHIKVTDFGLAKHHVPGIGEAGGATTFCGTGEYMSPEIIFAQIRSSNNSKSGGGHRYGKEVDWWSVGVVLYEMLSFDLPFKPDTASKTKDDKGKQLALFEKIIHEPIQFHKKLHSESSREVIRGFLCRDAPRRLGCAEGDAGFQAIQQMPFFRSLDFNLVLAKQIPVEFVPPKGKGAANFDREFTDNLAPMDSYIAPLSASEKRKTQFEDFNFAGEGGGGAAVAAGAGSGKVRGGLGKKR